MVYQPRSYLVAVINLNHIYHPPSTDTMEETQALQQSWEQEKSEGISRYLK